MNKLHPFHHLDGVGLPAWVIYFPLEILDQFLPVWNVTTGRWIGFRGRWSKSWCMVEPWMTRGLGPLTSCIVENQSIVLQFCIWGSTPAYSGFPGGSEVRIHLPVQEMCRRHRFHPWVGKIPWRRKWQPTPVFLPLESHEQRSRVGYSPWGHRESGITEVTEHTHTHTPLHIQPAIDHVLL